MKDRDEEALTGSAKSFQFLFEKPDLLARVVECCPYPIQIFSLDGTARLINRAALEMIGIRSVEAHVGK